MKQLLRVARLVVISAQHLSRHRLAEPPATSHTAITTLGIECHIYKWYQRRLVNILAIHNVAECIIAFIDIYTHNCFTCCRKDKPASDCKDTHKM